MKKKIFLNFSEIRNRIRKEKKKLRDQNKQIYTMSVLDRDEERNELIECRFFD